MHPYLIQASIKLPGKSLTPPLFSLLMIVTALATVALSVVVFALVEKPIQSFILNRGKKRNTAPSQPMPTT